MKRKFFTILTALALCLTLLPTAVWAEEGETPTATTTTVATADELTAAIGSADIVQLTADIEISGTLTISRTVTLDLNGHALKKTGGGSAIKVTGGTLTLNDSDSSTSHKFIKEGSGLWVLDEDNGTEIVYGGVLTGGTGTGQDFPRGGCVYVDDDGTFIMNGGTIVGGQTYVGGGIAVDGKFIMNSGAIKGCKSSRAGDAIYIVSGSMTANGGTVDGSAALDNTTSTDEGYDGTTFSGYVENYTNGLIKGGIFTGTVQNNGTIEGGLFTGQLNSRRTVRGGRFMVRFDLDGGTASESGSCDDQIIAFGVAVTQPAAPSKAGYTFDGWYNGNDKWDFDNNTVSKPITLTAHWTALPHDHCLCGTNTAYDGHDAHTDVSWEPWTAIDSLPNAAGYYYLTDNVVLPDGETTLPDGVFLCLNGKSVKSTGYVKVNGMLTITDCKDNSGSIGAFDLNSGKLTMYSGTISENTVFDPGTTFLMTGHAVNNGILEIRGDAVFTMEGNAESTNIIEIAEQPSVQATIRGNAKVTGMIQVSQPQEDARGLKLEGNAYVKTLCGTSFGTKTQVEMHDHAVIEDVNTLSVTLDIHDDAKISFSDPEQSISIAQAALQGNVQIAGKKITILINSGEYTLTLQDNVQITGDITLVTYNGDPLTLIMKDNSVIKGSLTYEQENEQSSLVMQDNAKIDGDLDMGKATVRGSVYCTGEIKSGIFDADSQVICDGTITGGTFYGAVSGNIADSATVAVTFDGGDAAEVQKVLRGQKAVKPTPTKSGYAFEGWFTDVECTQEYDFDTPVLEPLTLTAKWTRVSSGGGGGSRNNSYAVSTPKADNGSVTVINGASAKKGDTVSITVKPDAGYEIGTVTVTDSKGNHISLTDKGEGKYTFTMPDGKVDVKATFVQVEPDQPGKTTFVDVPNGVWYEDAANFVAERGLMSGMGENLFGGSQSTTRGMLMTILARMDGQDVTDGATWYEKGMNWAKANGVSDGTMPTANITREQLATMLYSYAKLRGIDTTQGGMAVREFNDYDSISPWAGQSMTWAVNAGILSGRGNNTLAPTAGATRAEMAVMLQQFVGLMEK